MSGPENDRFSEKNNARAVRGVDAPDIVAGVEAIRNVLATLPLRPGVYRMLNAKGDVLYVGKARALKNRVANYTQITRLPKRLQRMVAQTRALTIITTNTETEALLLEAQLIKRYRPAYNVLLRDDKSFPFILLREDHDFPRVMKHRGARRYKGAYFGPFASAGAVTRTLNALQKIFLLRTCTDSFYANRSRPCLLYQIKRCSAPCVDRISKTDYAQLVSDAEAFLSGRSSAVQGRLAEAMQNASDKMDFEMAAVYRDRLKALSFIQSAQAVNDDGTTDADIFGMAKKSGIISIQGFFIRGGQNWGHRSFFPAHVHDIAEEDVLESFLAQFYEGVPPPPLILIDRTIKEAELLTDALSERAGQRIVIREPKRGPQVKLLSQAVRNAEEALDRHLAESTTQQKLLKDLADIFELDAPPKRIEVYDNSHIQGTNALGAMIVAGPEGFIKSAYRKFNIKRADTAPGDDFAMMREVMERRFGRLDQQSFDHRDENWPDLILIDGGRGQLNAVADMLEELGISDITLVGVAKGPDRNAGRETFYLSNGRELTLPPNSPTLFYLQRLRDESHRFVIGAHRQKRAKTLITSPLDDIPGVGPARKKALLMHFGTSRGVRDAAIEDLEKAPGISKAMARVIYDYFNEDAG